MNGEWDFAGADTQYLTHGLHPYLASMIPQIPYRLLKDYANAESQILDPFVGGGSVLVEAYRQDLKATGVDVNPLSIILSKAKTTYVSKPVLLKVLELFDKVYPESKPDIPNFPKSSNIEYWFKDYMFEPLGKVRSTIREIVECTKPVYRIKMENLLHCIFSKTVRSVSLTYRNEIRLRKLEEHDLRKFEPEVEFKFRKHMEEAFFRIGQLPSRHRRPKVIQGDSRSLPFDDNEFNLVLTSPPYGDIKNTIPYHQFSKNMLYWLGFPQSDIDQIRHESLGSKNNQKVLPKSPSLQESIDQMNKSEAVSQATYFYRDYYDAVSEIARVTSETIIIVIGHRILNDVQINNAKITIEMIHDFGWEVQEIHKRKIKGKRINKDIAFGNNAKGGTIDTESILIFKKI